MNGSARHAKRNFPTVNNMKGTIYDLPGNVAIVSLFVFSPGRIVTTKALMAKTHIRSLKCVKLTSRIKKKSINKSIDRNPSIKDSRIKKKNVNNFKNRK